MSWISSVSRICFMRPAVNALPNANCNLSIARSRDVSIITMPPLSNTNACCALTVLSLLEGFDRWHWTIFAAFHDDLLRVAQWIGEVPLLHLFAAEFYRSISIS